MAWLELAQFQADAAIDWHYTPATAATLFRVRYLGSTKAWGRVLIGQASPYAPRERLNIKRFFVNTANADLYQAERPVAWDGNQAIACRPTAWSSANGLIIAIDAWIQPPGYDNPEIPVVICLDSLTPDDGEEGYQ